MPLFRHPVEPAVGWVNVTRLVVVALAATLYQAAVGLVHESGLVQNRARTVPDLVEAVLWARVRSGGRLLGLYRHADEVRNASRPCQAGHDCVLVPCLLHMTYHDQLDTTAGSRTAAALDIRWRCLYRRTHLLKDGRVLAVGCAAASVAAA